MSFLDEGTFVGKGAVKDAVKDPEFKALKSDEKANALKTLKMGGSVTTEDEEDNLDENVEKLLSSIEKLNDNQSELIELRFFEKLSFNEMGEQLGISSGNAKIRLYRAVDALKKQFKIVNEKI